VTRWNREVLRFEAAGSAEVKSTEQTIVMEDLMLKILTFLIYALKLYTNIA
jgi:hypothetical protein